VFRVRADVALVILLLAIAMFVPDVIEGVRNDRRDRDLARRISQQHDARKALEKRVQ
jgi:hypothetical protein